jgi:hypothetical protein
VSSGTSTSRQAAEGGEGGEGGGQDGGRDGDHRHEADHKRHNDPKQRLDLLREFLGTLPGLITAIAALITAIGGGAVLGDAIAGHSQAQPTVFVTVTAQPGTGASGPSPASTAGTATPSASAQASPADSTSTASAVSTAAAASGTELSTVTPTENNVTGYGTGTALIGTTRYPDSVHFGCSTAGDAFGFHSVVYIVDGSQRLNATFGVPDAARNAAGNSATITFYKDGSTTVLGRPFTVSLDNPRPVSLNLQGVSQLEISCVAANYSAPYNGNDIDVAIGDPTLAP